MQATLIHVSYFAVLCRVYCFILKKGESYSMTGKCQRVLCGNTVGNYMVDNCGSKSPFWVMLVCFWQSKVSYDLIKVCRFLCCRR